MVSAIAGADATGTVQTIRKVFGVGGSGSEFAGGRIGVGIGGGRRDRQDVGNRIGGRAYGRRSGGRGAGKLQSAINGSIFQSAKVADFQVALFFLFLDSSTAAFGHRSELEKMLDVRYGGAEGLLRNEKMYSLINDANGTGVVWAVLNPAYTRLAMQQLAPQIQQFPEAAKLVTRMQNLIVGIQASGGIDGKFQAICGSVDDANTLAQLMTLAFAYQQYQAKQQNPDLADLLGRAQVNPAGDRVVLRLALTDDQITSLIKKNTFALKM